MVNCLILLSLIMHTSATKSANTTSKQGVFSQENTTNGNDNAATKPNRYGLKMSFVPPPCSSIAVGTTVTKEPASFAADDTSSNTSHVGDLRQPTTDTALA
eukprot:gene31362-8932_t